MKIGGTLPRLAGLLVLILSCRPASAQSRSFLYSTNGISNEVTAYQINSSAGAHGVTSDPSGGFLFVVTPGQVRYRYLQCRRQRDHLLQFQVRLLVSAAIRMAFL
ncbi:MAG: hypothetical protein JWO80_1410 [Bryobacterales bacterium]|nr:hypothetical protein [Bryobacterales bacterium]